MPMRKAPCGGFVTLSLLSNCLNGRRNPDDVSFPRPRRGCDLMQGCIPLFLAQENCALPFEDAKVVKSSGYVRQEVRFWAWRQT